MPRRDDIKKILVIGSGPIVIGQACEFDYSGAQACKVLREDGYEVVLVNSNPATIMTDPEFADRTYVEPITPEFVEKVIAAERPDALLPTLGGQTGLNCAVALAEAGVLERYGVELIGAQARRHQEGRGPQALRRGDGAHRARRAAQRLRLLGRRRRGARGRARLPGRHPARRFTMGGAGGGIAYNIDELRDIVAHGVALSPIGEVLVEESVIGWKEFEMEVMRDVNDNAVIVCSIENVDAMGVHTGDSITVAPAQTLTDREYQTMRDASHRDPARDRRRDRRQQRAVRGEPRRRPHGRHRDEPARVALLRAGVQGDRLPDRQDRGQARRRLHARRDRQRHHARSRRRASSRASTTPSSRCRAGRSRSSRAPTTTLTTRMKSVGEAMAIGRTFDEALGKAFRSLENGRGGPRRRRQGRLRRAQVRRAPRRAQRARASSTSPRRSGAAAASTTSSRSRKIDPWFLRQHRGDGRGRERAARP